ncbi:MAG TPA: acyltransferase, partial [Burkholderiaceae bacterium]|nr:acyltransferase [Burkholderiaceae bacterium]
MLIVTKHSDPTFWDSLHGLRGVALLYVLLSHLGIAGFFLAPVGHNGIGKIGVWIFFGLSAFLLTSRLYASIKQGLRPTPALVGFLTHRIFRIYPLYVLVVIAHAIVRDITPREVLEHIFLLSGFQELWAIPVEFKYYFWIPVIVLFAALVGHINAITTLGIVFIATSAFAFTYPSFVFSNALTLLPKVAPFLLGSILGIAAVELRPGGDSGRFRYDLLGVISLLLLVICTFAYREWIKDKPSTSELAPMISILTGIAVVGLMRALLAGGVIARIFALRPLVILGEISFSVYLLHMFLVRFATRFTVPDARELWAWPIFAAAIVAGWLSYT